MAAVVRELRDGEADLLRRARLRALAAYPEAFADSSEAAIARPASYWSDLCGALVPPSRQRMYLLELDGEPIGSVFALLDRSDPKSGRLGGMWVAPEHRGKGHGRALLDTVINWARGHAFDSVKLWVDDVDSAAKRLYLRAGFLPTGVVDASREKIDKVLIEMALEFKDSLK